MLHPEVLHVFENVCLDRPLSTDLPPPHSQPRMLGAYLEALYVPVLVEAGVIQADADRACGYRNLYANLSFTGPKGREELAFATLANAENIARSVDDADAAEDTIFAFISRRLPRGVSRRFFQELKELLRRHINEPDSDEADATAWRLAVIGKVFPR